MPERETRIIAPPKAVIQMYFKYTRRHPWLLAAIALGMTMVQGSALLYPLFLRRFFNLLAYGHHTPDVVHSLIITLALVASMWLLDWAGRRVGDPAVSYLESGIMKDLSSDAFGYLIDHSYNFFISNFAGSLVHKVSKYTRSFEALFDSVIVQFMPTFIFVSGAIIVLFFHNHILGLALGIWSILFIWFQIWVTKLRQPIRVARAQADTCVTAALADAIGNQATIAQFSGTAYERGLLGEALERWRKATWRAWLTDNVIWAAIGLFMMVIEVGLLGGAIFYWQRGLLTLGDFVLIQTYLLTTFDRLVSINRELRRFYDALADAGEMISILEAPHEVQDVPGAKPLSVARAEINFIDVDFSFTDTRTVLEQFSLAIKSGEKVALVGPSGAGKSTITKLLLRLYDVSGGAIEIDGQNIAQATQESVRSAIAFVPQEPILFHRTLMENIRYGRRGATDEEVMEAAKKAHCHEFISELQDGYDTYVGERGVKLSGGERQRVAIARAILKNALILVLDEATSSLDSESEHLIQDALATLMKGKTVIVIAHRLSTIMRMDRIIVLEQGKIVDQGAHDELLAREGLYKKLWSIQAGGFLVDAEDLAFTPHEGEVIALLQELEEEISDKESEHEPRG